MGLSALWHIHKLGVKHERFGKVARIQLTQRSFPGFMQDHVKSDITLISKLDLSAYFLSNYYMFRYSLQLFLISTGHTSLDLMEVGPGYAWRLDDN